MPKKPGIYEDDIGAYYGHQSEFPTIEDFLNALADEQFGGFLVVPPGNKVKQVYARYCVAKCEWHEHDIGDGYWHIEYEPGRGRTKVWQYGDHYQYGGY